MSEDFQKLIVGSDYEGSEGMFQQPEQEATTNPEELQQSREKRGIFPDAQERLTSTLQELGLEQVQTLENGQEYPSLDRWVEVRISNERGTKFFPSFVRDKEGKTFFCKSQLSENPDALRGLDNEAKRLQEIPEGVTAPTLVQYIGPQEGHAAVLITELVPIHEAAVIPAQRWTTKHAVDAVQQIKIMEEHPQESQESRNFSEEAKALLEGAGSTIPPELRTKIETIITNYQQEPRGTFVHGDAGLKNVLAGIRQNDQTVRFVDWEFNGIGFKGQDAAKLWSGLQKNPEAGNAFLDAYIKSADGTVDESRKNSIAFGVIVENLAHLKWRNENFVQTGKLLEHPHIAEQIQELNQRITDILELTGN